jgi:hypothetical protein
MAREIKMECECRQIAVSFDKDGTVTDVHCVGCQQEYELWPTSEKNEKQNLKKLFAMPVKGKKNG